MPGQVKSDSDEKVPAGARMAYDEVRSVGGVAYWLESRPGEGGRVALVRRDRDGAVVEVTPRSADVGSRLHGYGGGVYAVDGGRVWYVDAGDRGLRLVEPDGLVRLVVGLDGDGQWCGDLSAAGGRLWCVRERPDGDDLIEVGPDGSLRTLVETGGFLGYPQACGGRLAWLGWDADRMPWDGSELWVATLRDGEVGGRRRVAGGVGESVTQPCWGADGRLWFVSDRSGWWNLYVWNGRRVEPVTPMAADVTPPQWEAGYASYAPLPDGRVVVTVHDGPWHRLMVWGPGGLRPVDTTYTSFKPYLAWVEGRVLAIAGSPSVPPQVVEIDVDRPGGGRVLTRPVPADGLAGGAPAPQTVRVPVGAGVMVTALVYPPAGGGEGWCAPLVVRAHPGPTASASSRMDEQVRALTGRGFAVADVDYRGSAGYGRVFRRSLYGQWGSADVLDCDAVARHLLAAGHTRPGQIFISGASAGGYTALQAVSQPSVFTAAVARSAIVDPRRWCDTAPRWQRPHAAALLGPAGAVDAAAIDRPVLLIHGAEDHVAPLADVTALAEHLAARGHRHELIILDAGHRMSARQQTARVLEAELAFYHTILNG